MQIKKAKSGYNSFFLNIPYYFRIIILLCIPPVADSFSQPGNSSDIQLQPQLINLEHNSSYFILDVEEGRKTPHGRHLGNIIADGTSRRIGLNIQAEKALYAFWAPSTPHRNMLSVPVSVKINDLKFKETMSAANTVKGTLDVTFEFYWIRQQIPTQLVQYKAQQSYTRSVHFQSDYETLLRNSLVHALQYFDKWMAENEGKNPALARGISIKFIDNIPSDNRDTVFYNPDTPLVWQDFRGESSPRNKYAASIFTSFSYEGNAVFKDLFLELTLSFQVFMVKDMSWRKSGTTSDYSLAHEQLHFDIVQVIVNRFKHYLSTKELSIEDYDSQIQYQYIHFFREMNKLQKAYDDDTNHGLDTVAQKKWQEKIANELAGK